MTTSATVQFLSRRFRKAGLLALGAAALAALTPAYADPMVAAVQVKPANVTPDDIAQIRQLGFNGIRVGIRREQIMGKNGAKWAKMDEIFNAAHQNGLTVVATIIDGAASSKAPAATQRYDPAGFADFAAHVVQRYDASGPAIWEIWNEPDNPSFWLGPPNPAVYADLAAQTCGAIRRVAPGATLIGGAIGTESGSVYESFIDKLKPILANKCINGISIHPYRQTPPETVVSTVEQLRQEYPGVVFYISEWGYTAGGRAYNAQTAAAYAGRMLLASKMAKVPLAVLYEWRNNNGTSDMREANFGMIADTTDRAAQTPLFTPVAESLKWLGTGVSSCSQDSGSFLCRVKNDGGNSKYLIWSASCVNVAISSPAGSATTHRWGGPVQTISLPVTMVVGGEPVEINPAGTAVLKFGLPSRARASRRSASWAGGAASVCPSS